MAKTRPPYTPEFRRQMVELVRAGRSPEEGFMRTIPLVAMTFAAPRADGTWCAQYSNHGATNCGFYSFGQCRATVSGIGGFCMRNPFSTYGSAREPRWRYRRDR
jgi:Protein of unknown function (DUF3551)